MGHQIVDSGGYPIGELYLIQKYMEEDLTIEKDRRSFYMSIGVPKTRFLTIVPIMLCYTDDNYALGLKTDYEIGCNIPNVLSS